MRISFFVKRFAGLMYKLLHLNFIDTFRCCRSVYHGHKFECIMQESLENNQTYRKKTANAPENRLYAVGMWLCLCLCVATNQHSIAWLLGEKKGITNRKVKFRLYSKWRQSATAAWAELNCLSSSNINIHININININMPHALAAALHTLKDDWVLRNVSHMRTILHGSDPADTRAAPTKTGKNDQTYGIRIDNGELIVKEDDTHQRPRRPFVCSALVILTLDFQSRKDLQAIQVAGQ